MSTKCWCGKPTEVYTTELEPNGVNVTSFNVHEDGSDVCPDPGWMMTEIKRMKEGEWSREGELEARWEALMGVFKGLGEELGFGRRPTRAIDPREILRRVKILASGKDLDRRCPRGHRARLTYTPLVDGERSQPYWRVVCEKDTCWRGPLEDTQYKAVKGWNERSDERGTVRESMQ